MVWRSSFKYGVDCPLLVETVNSSSIFHFYFQTKIISSLWGPHLRWPTCYACAAKRYYCSAPASASTSKTKGTEQPNPLISRIASSKKKAPLQHQFPPPNHRPVYYPQAPRAEIISTVPTDPTRPEVAFVSFLRSQQPIRLNSERTSQQDKKRAKNPLRFFAFPFFSKCIRRLGHAIAPFLAF